MRVRTEVERAAGRLVSAIQREWVAALGTAEGSNAERVLQQAHGLLLAIRRDALEDEVGQKTVSQYLGADWVEAHAVVKQKIEELVAELQRMN